MTVKDAKGETNSTSQNQKVVVNQPPVCGISYCNIWFLQVSCNSNSTDDNGISNYLWQWGDSHNNSESTSQSSQHLFSLGSNFSVKLTVTDSAGLSSTCSRSIITIDPSPQNNPPVSVFGYWSDNLILNFWFGGWDTDGQIVSYLWDFGDGKTSSVVGPSHTYATTGTYVVTLTVTDNRGGKGVSSQTLVVSNPPKNYHVESISKSIIQNGSMYYGQMTVRIYDNNGKPLSNVIVAGQISHPPSILWDNVQGKTDSNGQVVLTTANGRSSLPFINACAYSFYITGGTNLWYNQSQNKITSNCI